MLNYIYKHLFSLFSLLISFISIEKKLHMDFLVFKTPYCPLFFLTFLSSLLHYPIKANMSKKENINYE